MRRLALILALATILGGVILVAPLAGEAQQAGKVPRIGWLSASSPAASSDNRKAFMEGLLALGWIEGKNIRLVSKICGELPAPVRHQGCDRARFP